MFTILSIALATVAVIIAIIVAIRKAPVIVSKKIGNMTAKFNDDAITVEDMNDTIANINAFMMNLASTVGIEEEYEPMDMIPPIRVRSVRIPIDRSRILKKLFYQIDMECVNDAIKASMGNGHSDGDNDITNVDFECRVRDCLFEDNEIGYPYYSHDEFIEKYHEALKVVDFMEATLIKNNIDTYFEGSSPVGEKGSVILSARKTVEGMRYNLKYARFDVGNGTLGVHTGFDEEEE